MTIDRIPCAVSSPSGPSRVRRRNVWPPNEFAITLLQVVEPVKRRSVRDCPPAKLRAPCDQRQKGLARYAGEIAANDRLPVDFRIEIGEKVSSIMRACKEADVLFIGGTNMSGLAAALHMSTAERLIGKCGIPILVVNGPHQGCYARALVPANGTYQSVAAVSAAARLWPDAELTLFHAMDTRQEEVMRMHEVPAWAVRERHSLRIASGLKYLKALATRAQVSTKSVALRLAYGDAWRAVLSLQDEVDAQVVVMMKRKSTSLADVILGSTVRRLLSRLRCDVLVTPATPGLRLSAAQGALKALPRMQPE